MAVIWRGLGCVRDGDLEEVVTADEDVQALVAAMDQLLDDMGKHGQCVCLYAKAQARIAFEPFRNPDNHTNEFTLAEAKEIAP